MSWISKSERCRELSLHTECSSWSRRGLSAYPRGPDRKMDHPQRIHLTWWPVREICDRNLTTQNRQSFEVTGSESNWHIC
jgi:hypothetical protein